MSFSRNSDAGLSEQRHQRKSSGGLRQGEDSGRTHPNHSRRRGVDLTRKSVSDVPQDMERIKAEAAEG